MAEEPEDDWQSNIIKNVAAQFRHEKPAALRQDIQQAPDKHLAASHADADAVDALNAANDGIDVEHYIPKTWREAIPLITWVVLVVAAGLVLMESLGELIHSPAWRAFAAFAVMVGLTAMLIHWRAIRESLPLAYASGVMIVVIALSPFVEQRRWPFSGHSSDSESVQLPKNLPNSPNGLPPGSYWNNGGVLAITPQVSSAPSGEIDTLRSQLDAANQQLRQQPSAQENQRLQDELTQRKMGQELLIRNMISPRCVSTIVSILRAQKLKEDSSKTIVIVTNSGDNRQLGGSLSQTLSWGFDTFYPDRTFWPASLPDNKRFRDLPVLSEGSQPGITVHGDGPTADAIAKSLARLFDLHQTSIFPSGKDDKTSGRDQLLNYYHNQ